jgi:phage-related protein
MVFDELEVGMDLSTSGFTSGIDRAEDETSDMSRVATELSTTSSRAAAGLEEMADEAVQAAAASGTASGRVDNLADQLRQVGRSATTAIAGITGYTSATSAASGASATWSAVMTASLVPALASLALVLGPLVATIGGVAAAAASLAAAFGVVIGSGFLAYGRQLAATMPEVDSATAALAKRFGQLGSEIAAIVAPLGQQFVPLIREAVNALPGLVRRVVASLGPLDQFAAALRTLGGLAASALPQLTGAMMDLARQSLPAFMEFVRVAGDRAPGALARLRTAFKRTAPLFGRFAGATVALLPGLLRLGTTITTVLLPALTGIVGALRPAIEAFNDLPQPIRRAVAAAGLLASAFVVAVPALTAVAGAVGALISPLGAVIVAISAAAGAWMSNLFDIRATTTAVFRDVRSRIAGFVAQIREQLGGGPMQQAVNSFLGIITNALYGQFQDALTSAENAVADFRQGVSGHLQTLQSVAESIINGWVTRLQTAMTGALAVAQAAWDRFGPAIREGARRVGSAIQGLIDKWNSLSGSAQIVVSSAAIVGAALLGLTNPITGVIAALAGLTAAWQGNLFGIRDITQQVVGQVEQAWQQAVDFLTNRTQRTLNRVRGLWEAWGPTIVSTAQRIWGLVTSVVDTAVSELQSLVDVLLGHWETIWQTHGDRIIATARRIWGLIQDVVAGVAQQLRSRVERLVGIIQRLWATHGDDLVREARETWAHIRSVITDYWEWVRPYVSTAIGALLTIINTGLDRIQQFWDQWGDEITTIVDFVMSTVAGIVQTGLDGLLTAIRVGLNLIQGDWNEAWDAIAGFAERTLDRVLTHARTWAPKLLDVMSSTLTQIVTAVANWVLPQQVRTVLSQVLDVFRWLYDRLIGGSLIPEMLAAISGAVRSWNIASAFRAPLSDALGTVRSIMGEIESAVSAALSSVESAASSMVSEAQSALSRTGSILDSARSRIRNFDPPDVDDVVDDHTGGDDGGDDGGGDDGGGDDSGDGGGVGPTTGIDVPSGTGGSGGSDGGTGGGGGGGGVGTGGSDSPFGLQHGGLTRGEGLAYLHPNEAVMGVEAGAEAIADAMGDIGAPQIVVEEGAIQVDGADDPEQVADAVLDQLDRKRRRLYPDG